MPIPTIKLTVRTSGQNGLDIPNARVTARLTTPVVYQGYVLPKSTTVETNGSGECVLNVWPNELGTTMSQYQVKIQDITTGKTFTVYAFVPNRDCNLWEITDFATGLVLPDGVIGVPGAAATIRLAPLKVLAPGMNPLVQNIGNFNHAIFEFSLPKGVDGAPGKDGLNGSGTVVVGSVATLPPGSTATVVNVGTADRAVLNFGIPKGEPGLPGVGGTSGGGTAVGVPPGGLDGQVLTKSGNLDYSVVWRNPAAGGGAASEIYISLLPWENGGTVVVPPNFTPALDATTQAEYASAIQNAALGSKRLAGANKLIAAFGTARRLTILRDGVVVISIDYTGAMPLYDNGVEIGVSLGAMSSASDIVAADLNTGTWTANLAGGNAYSRTANLTVGPVGSGKMLTLSASPAPGMGINPSFVLVAPRSVDGLS